MSASALFAGSVASAQQPTSHSSVDSAIRVMAAAANAPVDSAAVARAAAIADTGRMAPGYRDLSRYNTPGYCVAAVRGAQNAVWRKNERALIEPRTPQDTLPTAAMDVGRRCLAALPSVAQVTPAELPNLFQLAMLLDDTARVQAVVARQLALANTTEARGYVLSDAIGDLLGVGLPIVRHPLRLAMATTMLARLDSLGRDARIPQLVAHVQMRNTAVMVNFDTTALIREDKALRTVIATLTPDERLEYKGEVGAIMTDSVILAWTRRESPLPAVVRRLLQQEVTARGPSGYSEKEIQGVLGWIELLASQVGKPAPPITGKFWFPTDSPHVQPAPGKVTLLMKVQKDQGLMSARMAMLRRLYDRYHDRGLDIVLILQTEGFSWSSPPQSPADEAKTIAWYYYDFLRLPFKVVVDVTPFTTKADGRRVSGQIAFNRQYVLPQIIVGRDGRIFTLWLGLESESQMRAFIEQALAAPVSSASASTGGAMGGQQ